APRSSSCSCRCDTGCGGWTVRCPPRPGGASAPPSPGEGGVVSGDDRGLGGATGHRANPRREARWEQVRGIGIMDVARRAGVSAATVSRALRGLPNVSRETRTKVLTAADDLGYAASPLASALATGRMRSVGVVLPYAGRWFFAEAVRGIEAALRRHGYDL